MIDPAPALLREDQVELARTIVSNASSGAAGVNDMLPTIRMTSADRPSIA